MAQFVVGGSLSITDHRSPITDRSSRHVSMVDGRPDEYGPQMTADDDAPRSTWRSYLGPVVLTSRRRWGTLVLLVAWSVATIVVVVIGRYDIVWLPVVGIVTSSTLLLRDRAGRRRST